MMNDGNVRYWYLGWVLKAVIIMLASTLFIYCGLAAAAAEQRTDKLFDLDEIAKTIDTYALDPRCEDDPFILITLKEALVGARQHNGGIGACLVREATGEIVERSPNQQHMPYFKSDLHAEMVVLDRYEDHMRFTRDLSNSTSPNPRDNMKGLILYTSVEPCPMCFTRIINSGVKKIYYAASDDTGGMAHRLENLPPSWQGMAKGMVIEPARCSPALRELAQKLFHPMKE